MTFSETTTKTKFLRIKPTFSISDESGSFQLYIASIEALIRQILPDSLLEELEQENHPIEVKLNRFRKMLPLFHHTEIDDAPCTLSITSFSPNEYTSGIERYLSDMFSRWLAPGKNLPIVGMRTLEFQFTQFPKQTYSISQHFVRISDSEDLFAIKNHLPTLFNELRINILAVYQARYIVSLRHLSPEQKNTMIEENLTSLINLPSKSDHTVYDHIQNFLIQLSAEEKIPQVNENIRYLMHARPKIFDRDVFYEVRNFLALFREKFTATRDPRYISRLIAYQYLFKKTLRQAIKTSPQKRHLSMKVLKTHSDDKTLLGVLLSINLLRDSERFEKRHILEAIRSCIPDAQYVKESYILDRRDDKILSFYIEVSKDSATDFTKKEFKSLRKRLPYELKSRVENVIHPIFMPRNEEEVLRNIISLSKQLKYVRDIPQVIISYDKQSNSELIFTVILMRLLRSDTSSLKELFFRSPTYLKCTFDETKTVGYLKRKYPKEANIFRVALDKSPFFRKDFSLDLQKARQCVVTELMKILGEFRDFNGGMIHKQSETLDEIRKELVKLDRVDDFLLDNFFYSLRPGHMQSILSSDVLLQLFLLLTKVFEKDFSKSPFYIDTVSHFKYFYLMIGARDPSFKEPVFSSITKLRIPSFDLTSSFLDIRDMSTLGFILRSDDPHHCENFYSTIHGALKDWESR